MMLLETLKAKNEPRLVGLNPIVKEAARKLIVAAYNRGVQILITQGLRTIDEQNALYAQGRTKPGSIVTNAKGGDSYHNYGLAIDFALYSLDGSKVLWDTKIDLDKDGVSDWHEVVEEAKKLGFAWGGDWKGFVDMPHFEMTFGLSIANLKAGKKPPTEVKGEPKVEPIKPQPSSWAKAQWDWAVREGLLDGSNPQQPMTREMFAVVLHKVVVEGKGNPNGL